MLQSRALLLMSVLALVGVAVAQKPKTGKPKTDKKQSGQKFTDGRKTFVGIDGDVAFATILPKTGQIFAVGSDYNFRWWDAATKQLNLKPHDCFPGTTTLSPDAKSIAIAGTDGDLRVIRTMDGRTMVAIGSTDGAAICTFWSPDSNRVGLVTRSGHIRIYDVDTKELQLDIPSTGADLADFTKDGDSILTHNARSLKVYDAKNGDLRISTDHVMVEKGNTAGILTFSPDRALVAVGFGAPEDDEEKDVDPPYIFDPASRKSVAKFPDLTKPVLSCAFSADGTKVAFGLKGKAAVYDVATQKRLYQYSSDHRILTLSFSKDGKSLLLGESGGGLFLIPYQK